MPFTVKSWAAFVMPCRAFLRSVWLFIFVLVLDICARRFQACSAFFVALRWCFPLLFVFVCLLLAFGCVNGAKLARFLAFSWFCGVLYRVEFCAPCRGFILAVNGIPIFYHFLEYFGIF